MPSRLLAATPESASAEAPAVVVPSEAKPAPEAMIPSILERETGTATAAPMRAKTQAMVVIILKELGCAKG